MVTSLKEQPLKVRPVYRNIHVTQLTSYRLPPAGWVSILHRISGALMFLLLPFAIWMFDASLDLRDLVRAVHGACSSAGAWGLPGWLWKLVAFALIWGYLMHFCAGLRHLWMDATHAVGLEFGRNSALVAIALSTVLTLALGAKLFGLLSAMASTYGSKRLVVGAHYGLRDWLSQRFTALIMAIFTDRRARAAADRRADRLLQVVGDLRPAVDEGAHLRRHRLDALARLGRHARHLDGLRQAGGRAPRACRS